MKRLACLFDLPLIAAPTSALAWGYEGHEVIADITCDLLTPALRAKVDALLATDTDALAAHDMAAEATWVDACLERQRQNASGTLSLRHDQGLSRPDSNAGISPACRSVGRWQEPDRLWP